MLCRRLMVHQAPMSVRGPLWPVMSAGHDAQNAMADDPRADSVW